MEKIGIGIIGCGFVADYYMATMYAYPHLEIRAVFDIDQARLNQFCRHYKVQAAQTLEEVLKDDDIELIINLTNPDAHFEVSKQCLLAGKNVYSEKPLAMNFTQANELVILAEERGLLLSSAPCNALGRAAQNLKRAVDAKIVGDIKLVYAELEDGFVPIMPFRKWFSASGAPWPYKDEFEVGCTLEHAGYYLGIFVLIFGEIESITAFSDCLITNKVSGEALDPSDSADMSVGVIKFQSGVVVRLTTTIIAERNYGARMFGETGILRLKDCWDNSCQVIYQRYINIRRRTMLNPFPLKVPSVSVPVHKMQHSKTRMDFLLGVADLAKAIQSNTSPTLSAQTSLHVNEAAIALQYAGTRSITHVMQSKLSEA